MLCDLKTGETTDPALASGQFVAIALHDDGVQIIARSTAFGWGKNDRLEVWKANGEEVLRTLTWAPYDFETGGNRDVVWAAFLDEERLATCNSLGKVIFWKFPEIRPIAMFDTNKGTSPALSPDRKMLAYSVGNGIGVLDISKQKVLAQESVSSSNVEINLAFSPSTRRLAGLAGTNLLIWDLATGKLEHSISCDGLQTGGHIHFVDENFVLVGNTHLVDIENELKHWTYQGAEQIQFMDGTVFFAISAGTERNGALFATQLPHSDAKDLLQRVLTNPEEFVLKSGTAVRIDVSGIPDASQRDRVVTALTKQLAAIQCTVDPNGTIDLTASVEGPKEKEISFFRLGDYKFKEFLIRIRFVYQKQAAWESVAGNTPGVVQLKSGESMQDHLRGLEKPPYEFFDRLHLPKFLSKPIPGQPASHSLTLGTSNITVDGIR